LAKIGRKNSSRFQIVGIQDHAKTRFIAGFQSSEIKNGRTDVTAAIHSKTSQPEISAGTPEERLRREILLQNAAEVLLNADKRRAYDERVFKVDAVAPAASKNVEPTRMAYTAPPVSGMSEADDTDEIPSTSKRWVAYGVWFVVWVGILGILSAPLSKVPLGAILGGIVGFCNLAILLYGILLIRQKFKVAPSDGARKNWIILGISILVLLSLRLYLGGARQLEATRAETNARAAAAFAEQEKRTAAAEKLAETQARQAAAAPSAYLMSLQAEYREWQEIMSGPRGASLEESSRRSGIMNRLQVLGPAIAAQTAAETQARQVAAAPSSYLLSLQAEHKEWQDILRGPRGSSLEESSRRSGAMNRLHSLEQAIAAQTIAEAQTSASRR
ncbi:MAG: hypothetical protein KBF41_15935, partial [Azonexus sp.]|nr:hypothetical protein [Azonexus sp.]